MKVMNDIIEEKRPTEYGDLMIIRYQKGRLLGKGGFAQCYEVREIDTDKLLAAKLIDKKELAKPRTRQKLLNEVNIHKAMHHTNIVSFKRFFEDTQYAYILLELCPNKTMKELLKKRKRLQEVEAQCYMRQLIEAVKYMHDQSVIHRDLKLGNLFLGKNFEIKIGDFGLAAKLSFSGEKRKTVCGTPNYIAPEVITSKVNGHSFEADIWSIGVIFYTLLIGKPPFETSNMKTTYKKIRDNAYTIPEGCISAEAELLIARILVSNPSQRPSLDSILKDPFMIKLAIPKKLSTGSLIFASEKKLIVGNPIKAIPNTAGTLSIRRLEGIKKTNEIPPINLRADLQHNTAQKPSSSLTGTIRMHIKISQQSKPLIKPLYYTSTNFKAIPNIAIPNTSRTENGQKFNIRKASASATITSRALKTNFEYVEHYKSYIEKYGIGYIVTNGVYGFYYNDLTNILWLEGKKLYGYSNFHSKEENAGMVYFSEAESLSKENLEKKVKILRHFIDSCEKEKLPLAVTSMEEVCMKKIIKTKHGILFRLTNNVAQMIFIDRSQIVLCLKTKTLIYIDKKGTKEIMKISSELMSTGEEKLVRRLKYTLNILAYLKTSKKTLIPNKQQDENNNDILQIL